MKKMSFEKFIKICISEKKVILSDMELLVRQLLKDDENEIEDFEDYDYDNSSRKKVFDLANLVAKPDFVIMGQTDDFHNTAVEYARNKLFSCACIIIERGLQQFNYSVDLLADLISYRLKSGQDELCKTPYYTLLKISKELWNWRAFSFSIDYQISWLNHIASEEEKKQIYQKVLELSDVFIERWQSDQAYYEKASIYRCFGPSSESSDNMNEEKVLRLGIEKVKKAPRCSLRLADILFEKGEYEETIKLVRRCCENVFSPQPDINGGYAFLLLALSKASKLFESEDTLNNSTENEYIKTIYTDFHTAISNGLNGIYKNAANSAIRTLEAQTEVTYPFSDADSIDNYEE